MKINETPIHTDQMVDSTPRGIMRENNNETPIHTDQIVGSTPQRVKETRRRSRLRCAQTGDKRPQSSNELAPHPKCFKVTVSVTVVQISNKCGLL